MRSQGWGLVSVLAIVGLTASSPLAQTTATTSETKKFEVIAVTGNDLVVRLPEGTRELTVPDDFRFTVDGKQLSVHQLKPGMAGTATITTRTTTTPVVVTEVKNGTVAHAAGSTLIVRTDEGIRSFTQADIDKRGVKIYRSGKPAQLSDFRSGDRLSATIVTTKPPQVLTEQEVQATLAAAAATPRAGAPPRPAPAGTPTSGPAAATSASVAPTARKLPKTAGPIPLIGLVGLTSVACGALLTRRRRLSR